MYTPNIGRSAFSVYMCVRPQVYSYESQHLSVMTEIQCNSVELHCVYVLPNPYFEDA